MPHSLLKDHASCVSLNFHSSRHCIPCCCFLSQLWSLYRNRNRNFLCRFAVSPPRHATVVFTRAETNIVGTSSRELHPLVHTGCQAQKSSALSENSEDSGARNAKYEKCEVNDERCGVGDGDEDQRNGVGKDTTQTSACRQSSMSRKPR